METECKDDLKQTLPECDKQFRDDEIRVAGMVIPVCVYVCV